MIIDFHSHILPGFDDGADNVETSLKMLEASKKMGVDTVVSTSHCYAYSNSELDKLIVKRNEAYEALNAAIQNTDITVPDIKLGCEVHLTGDITRLRNIKAMCLEGTDYMLIEMPMTLKWTEETIENIYKLTVSGIKPIIAHAERYLSQPNDLIESLYTLDILIQINAESFGFAPLKRFIDDMMKKKMIHVIGTDMHNMNTRYPNMDRAQKYVTKRYGAECWEYLMNNAKRILNGEEINFRDLIGFKKKSLF